MFPPAAAKFMNRNKCADCESEERTNHANDDRGGASRRALFLVLAGGVWQPSSSVVGYGRLWPNRGKELRPRTLDSDGDGRIVGGGTSAAGREGRRNGGMNDGGHAGGGRGRSAQDSGGGDRR
jgi:hypothetical protein